MPRYLSNILRSPFCAVSLVCACLAGPLSASTPEFGRRIPEECVLCDSFKLAEEGYVFRQELDARAVWLSDDGIHSIEAFSLGNRSGQTLFVVRSNGYGASNTTWLVVQSISADIASPEIQIVERDGLRAFVIFGFFDSEPEMLGADVWMTVSAFDVSSGRRVLEARCLSLPRGLINAAGEFQLLDSNDICEGNESAKEGS